MGNNQGFSLVELAISVTVIGVLIAAVIKGQQVMTSAQMAGIMSDVNRYETAITNFRNIYDALPGDMASAIGDIPGCDTTSHCEDGDGDGYVADIGEEIKAPISASAVADAPESIQFWKHLALAGLVNTVDSSASTDVADLKWGVSHPKASVRGGYEFMYSTNFRSYKSQHFFRLAKNTLSASENTEEPGKAVLSPYEVAILERKYDDGNPLKGKIFAWGFGDVGCDDLLDGSGRGLDQTVTEKNCTVFFRVPQL